MVEVADSKLIQSRRKVISVLFPYAVHLARRGQWEILDAFSRAAKASDSERFMWHRIKPFTMTLFDKPNPPSLNWVLGLISPSTVLHDQPHNNSAVAWRAAAPPYIEEVDRSAVDEVLHVAFTERQPGWGPGEHPIRQVRALGDTGVLRSYLLLLWSTWAHIGFRDGGFAEMQISVREDFGGIGMWHHREDMIKRLDQVLEGVEQRVQPDESLEALERIGRIAEGYGELRELLLEVDGRAEKLLTSTPPWLIHSGLLI